MFLRVESDVDCQEYMFTVHLFPLFHPFYPLFPAYFNGPHVPLPFIYQPKHTSNHLPHASLVQLVVVTVCQTLMGGVPGCCSLGLEGQGRVARGR